jgi:hypothetical protein
VNDAEPMVQGRASDEEIWDRRSVPHAVVVSQIPLEIVSALEQVGRCGDDLEGIAQVSFKGVIVLGGTCRVKLLKLTDRTEEERSRQLGELRPHSLVTAARGGALVEEPTPYRHISSDASTATSTRRLNCSR